MAKRIKSVSELPDWFQLKKYDAAKELDAAGWYEQLSVRESAYEITTWFNYPEHHTTALSDMLDFSDVMTLIRQNPIVDVMNNDLLRSYFRCKSLAELKPKNLCYSRSVRPVTGEEFLAVLNLLISEKEDFLIKWWNSRIRIMHPREEWLGKPLYNTIDRNCVKNLVSINWDLPDDVLINHFKQFLITNRKKYDSKYNLTGSIQPPKKLNINSWHELAILPYLDLMIWQEEANVSIPNRVMANAIYPPGEYGEETIRKTTAPLAISLLDEGSLELLASYAAFEITEKNIK